MIFIERPPIDFTSKLMFDSLVNMKRPSSGIKFNKAAGCWLKGLRVEAGLTQQELSRRLSLKTYAYVSQIENGFSRVPTKKMEVWAKALGVDPSVTSTTAQTLKRGCA